MSHCGTSAFDHHLNHSFVILKDIQRSIGTRMFSAWWNVINVGQIRIGVRGVEFVFACLIEELPTDFCVALLHHWFCWFGLVRNEILQSPNPREWERESHPCVNLHRKEMISASVELCETEVCFFHIQLTGTNVWPPKMHRIPPNVDFESSRSPANSESWNNPNLHCCPVFPT